MGGRIEEILLLELHMLMAEMVTTLLWLRPSHPPAVHSPHSFPPSPMKWLMAASIDFWLISQSPHSSSMVITAAGNWRRARSIAFLQPASQPGVTQVVGSRWASGAV